MNKSNIKFFVMDIDGTLTDGKIYMGTDGELFKAFDIKDGYALYSILPEYHIIPVVITARNSPMVAHRCKELGITEFHQGEHDKLKKLKEILAKYSESNIKYDLSNVAYVGDDVLDLKCMFPIKQAGGLVTCPADAIMQIRKVANYVSELKAGEGAVREIVEWLTMPEIDGGLSIRVNSAIEYLKKLDLLNKENGTYKVNDNFYYVIKDYVTLSDNEVKAESHRIYADIQWIIQGQAIIAIQDERVSSIIEPYDCNRDVTIWQKEDVSVEIKMNSGSYVVINPGQIHIPMKAVNSPEKIKILIGKVK